MIRALLLLLVFTGCTQWEPLRSVPGASMRRIAGNPSQAGPFRYQIKMPPGSRLESHRHDTDMHVKVLRGSMFIMMSGATQHYKAGSSFTIPANTWHTEWWEEESVMEPSGVGPMKSEMAPSTSARLLSPSSCASA